MTVRSVLKWWGDYLVGILTWVDIGLNVILAKGSPKETISSRLGRRKRNAGGRLPWYVKWIDWLTDKFERGHITKAIDKVADYRAKRRRGQPVPPLPEEWR